MRAGRLRHRVTLQQRTDVQNALGEVTGVWSDVATVWGSVEPVVGREQIERDAEVATFSTRIRLRWRENITQEMRVVWVDAYRGDSVTHTYEIESVTRPFENRRELVLLCKEIL